MTIIKQVLVVTISTMPRNSKCPTTGALQDDCKENSHPEGHPLWWAPEAGRPRQIFVLLELSNVVEGVVGVGS